MIHLLLYYYSTRTYYLYFYYNCHMYHYHNHIDIYIYSARYRCIPENSELIFVFHIFNIKMMYMSLCIKSQSSSYLSQGGWARTTNCLGVYSCESVLHSLWLSLFSHTGFSQSIIRLSRRPQLCTLLWESSPNTATKPTPLPSLTNTNKTSLVRFCEASLSKRRCRNCSSERRAALGV